MTRLPALSLGILLCGSFAQAAEPDPLFASDDVLAITLTAPIELIDNERDKEKEYEGNISYTDGDGNEVVLNASFQVRGNWRLDPRNCNYSQLWVDLRRGELPGTLFANQNRLKLVVQCRNTDRYAEYVQQELQVYHMFSQLSDYYFDTRPLQVTYVDSEDPDSVRTHAGFFIEHQNRLSERLQMAEVEETRVAISDLNELQSTLVALFMFMIGNTDFSLIQGPVGEECCHNGKLLQADDGKYYPVPYDFDASGFVDTTYAPLPHPDFGLRNNRDRIYRGYCVDAVVLDEAVARFRDRREQLMAIVSEDPNVSNRVTRRNVRFMEEFFETLDDERDFRRHIIDDCRP